MDLALNNLQRLICHKNQPTNQPTNQVKIFFQSDVFNVSLMFVKGHFKSYVSNLFL